MIKPFFQLILSILYFHVDVSSREGETWSIFQKLSHVQNKTIYSLNIIEDQRKKNVGDYLQLQLNMQQPYQQLPIKNVVFFSQNCTFSHEKASSVLQRPSRCDRYYDVPSAISNCRTTSLGFGDKYDFTREASKSPPPNTYDLPSDFSMNKKHGFGFGKGRQQMQVTGPLATIRVNKNPGPGSYQIDTTLSKSAYSLTGKPHQEDKQKLKVPGPGTYPVTFCINEKGTYFLSKYKTSCVKDFSRAGRRAQTHLNKVPGPGSYDTSHVNLSPSGKYVVSRMKNCLTRKFAITTRKLIADNNQNPGPGNYNLPSEFGHYISKKTFAQYKNKLAYKVNKVEEKAKTQQTHQGV